MIKRILRDEDSTTVVLTANINQSVAGDITATLPGPEEEDVYYFLIPPAGVDWTTGTLDLTPPGRTSRCLAFQYLFIPPVAGVSIESETLGAQRGTNLSGMHYAWNRFYQPETGRWLTPDPAMSPWWNLVQYSDAPDKHGYESTGNYGQLGRDELDENWEPPLNGQTAKEYEEQQDKLQELRELFRMNRWSHQARFLIGLPIGSWFGYLWDFGWILRDAIAAHVRSKKAGWNRPFDHDWPCWKKCKYWKVKADHIVKPRHGGAPGKLATNEADYRDCLECCGDYRACGFGEYRILPGSEHWFTWLKGIP